MIWLTIGLSALMVGIAIIQLWFFKKIGTVLKAALSVGVNYFCNNCKHMATVHSERDAINRLPLRKSKNLKKVDILIIKTSKTGVLGNSHPCLKCIQDLNILPQKYGYKIRKVHFSNYDGTITSMSLSNLNNSDSKYKSKYYREKNWFIKKLVIIYSIKNE